MSAIYDLNGRFAAPSTSGVGRQGQNVAGIGKRTAVTADRGIAVVRDSDFRLLCGKSKSR